MIVDDSLLERALTSAVALTMENMAFEQADTLSPDSSTEESIPRNLWVTLPIIKPLPGEISIQLSMDYARSLAGSLFEGSDNLPTDELVKDALAEVLNTIAGRLMTQLVPSKEEFEMGLPRVSAGECPISKEGALCRNFDVGGHILTAYLSGVKSETPNRTDIKEERKP